VKPGRWSPHALRNLLDREIEREQADRTLAASELIAPGQAGRTFFMRCYFGTHSQQEMLRRIILEETTEEIVVVTICQTSQIDRYPKGHLPRRLPTIRKPIH
jgi:hypothetical protein